MSQRESGYERKERDLYETPEWVTQALLPHIQSRVLDIWEPAAGSGKMVRALIDGGHKVESSDITAGIDFLRSFDQVGFNAIVTNPPYEFAQQFIEHALSLMKPVGGMVAMLLRTDFDHAKTRQHLFGACPQFAKKLVLTKRIIWFEGPKAAPSFNHAWYLWNWHHAGPPTLAYGPSHSKGQ